MRVRSDQLGKALKDAINGISISAHDAIRGIMQELPVRAQSEAVRNYPSVLGVVTGHLRRSIEGFSRIESPLYFVGLRNKMEYADYKESGTRSGLNKAGNKRGMGQKATRFMSKPLKQAATKAVSRILKLIHLGGVK